MLFHAVALTFASSLAAAVSVTRRAAITDFNTSPIEFTWPPARGFTNSNATAAPCGGVASGVRTSYPISGGDIALTQQTDLENVNILYTNQSNPTKFHAFNSYSDSILNISAGHFCQQAPDFANLGFQVGDDATLLIIYQLEGVERYFYHCADINLVESSGFNAPVSYVCGNYTSTLDVASDEESLHLGSDSNSNSTSGSHGTSATTSSTGTGTGSSSGSAASESAVASSGSGISAAAGGGIGAAVTIVVIALLLVGAYFARWITIGAGTFGRKNNIVLNDGDHSSVSSAGVPIKHAHA
nr:uncharacterized protein CI109_006420 [Kwoniella shandongensis]KAA5525250.1 hypothetical protein CI109_006420 [Kwoniella shandongensis]